MMSIVGFFVSIIFISSLRQVQPYAIRHEYNKGDPITVYGNKVGLPSETYAYYTLPFCTPDSFTEQKPSLGEMLNGDRLVVTPYKIEFLSEKALEVLCHKNLTVEEVRRFRTAVTRNYYMELYVDDLPFWYFLGKVDRGDNYNHDEFSYFISTHLHFDIFYNGNCVTEVQVRTHKSHVTEVTMDKIVEVKFLYTVAWKESDTNCEDRMQKYSLSDHSPHHMSIHKLSIALSLYMVLILIGRLVRLYTCTLRRDFNKDDDVEELISNHNETGWKVLHGDVFRYPKYKSFFAAAIGCGLQFLTVIMSIILLGYAGVFRPYDRGGLKAALVFTYAATCAVAGYTAVSFYHQLEGTNWARTLFLTGILSFCPLAIAFSFLNTIATTYGTTIALPFSAITMIMLVWVLLALPSLLLGGLLGKLFATKIQAPCPTRDIPRKIPTQCWYRGVLPRMLLGGLLPFTVIYVQIYYIFASFWGLRTYIMYGVILFLFILFIISIALVSVLFTYVQLAAEDHQWWWRSFLSGGSTGLYMYAYCWYYYMERTDMGGFMQVSFFFGYMTWICYGLFLLSGSVAFGASFLFVRYIYSNIKCD